MRKLTAIVHIRHSDEVQYWLNATVSVTHLYQYSLAAVNAKNNFDALNPQQQRDFVKDLIAENIQFS